MKVLLITLLCGLLVGCASQPTVSGKPPIALTSEEADIYEAVFRYQFAKNASAAQQSAGTYFIQVRGADPSNTFLARFAGDTPPVKRYSEAQHARNSLIYDRETRKESLAFSVDAIRWHGKNSAEVVGGYYEGNMSASSDTYHLIRQGNKWRVVKKINNTISGIVASSAVEHKV